MKKLIQRDEHDLERMKELAIDDLEIVVDDDKSDRVEIYRLQNGVRVEGGTFDRASFMAAVMKYYDDNF